MDRCEIISCPHSGRSCLNHFELIRKYVCHGCGLVVMCSCEEGFARQFLPHQIHNAVDSKTQRRIPVTGGFAVGICNRCRGLPEDTHPKQEIYRRTTKVVRYYWREIAFEVIPRFDAWARENGYSDSLAALVEHQDKYHDIEREVVREIKHQHQVSPKYKYDDSSQEEILTDCNVTVENLCAAFAADPVKGATVVDGAGTISVEEFVSRRLREKGFESMRCESSPIHALYAVFMWLLFMNDDDLRPISFGERKAFEEGRKEPIFMLAAPDFGTTGYAQRRATDIDNHLGWLSQQQGHLIAVFDQLSEGSWSYRNKLWAHREETLNTARLLATHLPVTWVLAILRYLVTDFWARYLGWPDLVCYNPSEVFFAEVKGPNDRLSGNQKNWIIGNRTEMGLQFKLIKVRRQ